MTYYAKESKAGFVIGMIALGLVQSAVFTLFATSGLDPYPAVAAVTVCLVAVAFYAVVRSD